MAALLFNDQFHDTNPGAVKDSDTLWEQLT
jgi:hypothetical protein